MSIRGIDHVSFPMQNPDAMVSFYRALGFDVAENPHVVSVYAGDQMINLHRPEVWQRDGFTLRAPAARPPCGDLCFVWDGSAESLRRGPGRRGCAPSKRAPWTGKAGERPRRRACTPAIRTGTSWSS